MSEQIAMARLRDLGLTETESRLYIVLLKGGSDAKGLSQASGVPYSKIHTTLSKLISRSLVTEGNGRPAVYEARRINEGLAEFRRLEEEKIESKIRSAEEALTEMATANESEKPDIWIIRSQDEILRKSYQTLNGAKNEVDLALPIAPEWATSLLMPVLIRLKSADVSMKVLLTNQSSVAGLTKLKDIADIKIRDVMFGGGIIVDNREALLFIGNDGASVSLAIWSNHAGIIQIARSYFDYLWGPSAEAQP